MRYIWMFVLLFPSAAFGQAVFGAAPTSHDILCSNANGQVQNCIADTGPLINGIVSAGTKFTTSGCSISSTTGGATAGKFTLGANTCTAVITMNGATGLTSANGWACRANDETATTVLISESTSNTTTASFSIPAGAGATDVIDFSCIGY